MSFWERKQSRSQAFPERMLAFFWGSIGKSISQMESGVQTLESTFEEKVIEHQSLEND